MHHREAKGDGQRGCNQGVGCHNSLVIPQESPCNATGKKIIHTQPKTFAGPMDFTL